MFRLLHIKLSQRIWLVEKEGRIEIQNRKWSDVNQVVWVDDSLRREEFEDVCCPLNVEHKRVQETRVMELDDFVPNELSSVVSVGAWFSWEICDLCACAFDVYVSVFHVSAQQSVTSSRRVHRDKKETATK